MPRAAWVGWTFACMASAHAQDWNTPAMPLPDKDALSDKPCTVCIADTDEWTKPAALPDVPETNENNPTPLRLRLGLDYPLRTNTNDTLGVGGQGSPPVSPTLQAELRYNPISHWFGNLTFYRYLRSDRQQEWNPDFTYSFGYDNWRPNTFSFVYGNYTGNRLDPRGSESVTRIEEGNVSLGYKFRPPAFLDSLLKLDETDEINCSVNANFTPRYTDLQTLSKKNYKRSLSIGCRYILPNNWYGNATVFYYPNQIQQQPWDPDFIYGFGYFDWRPGTISIQYNNYSGNRFPKSDREGQGGFRRGAVSISWSTSW
jgi:hypothetical protein